MKIAISKRKLQGGMDMSRDNCRCREEVYQARSDAPPGEFTFIGLFIVLAVWLTYFLIVGLIIYVIINGWCSLVGCFPIN